MQTKARKIQNRANVKTKILQTKPKEHSANGSADSASTADRGSQLGLGPEWSLPELSGYDPVRIMGSGSFGQVVHARDISSGKGVAIKHMKVDPQKKHKLIQVYRELS